MNGSLDIRKLDAEVCLDPIELRLQPSTIKWFPTFMGNFPTVFAIDKSIPVHGSFTSAFSSFTGKESISEAMHPALLLDLFIFLLDDDQEDLYGQKSDQNTVDLEVHCLGAECKDIFVVLQVDSSDSNSGTVLIQNLQAEVQGALPPFPYLDESSTLVVPGVPSGNATKVKLLGTSGVTRCQFTVRSNSSNKSCTGTKSLSVQLPLLIFWVNYGSVNMILSLLKDAEKSVEMSAQRSEFPSVNKKREFSHGNMKKGSSSEVSTLTCTENLQGSISIPCARVILCFPFASGGDVGGHSSWNQFIAFDISSPLTLKEGKVLENSLTSNSCSWKRQAPRATDSLHLNVGNLEVYLVNPACKNDGISSSTVTPRRKFCAQKIVSVSNRAGSLCAIKMLWQEDPVTGPSIAEIAKSLAAPESRRKFMVKGYEFASATAVKDLGDLNSRTREEIILSSAFFLHVHLFSVTVDVSTSQYSNLHCLLDQMITGLPGMACDAVSVGELPSVSQTSILVECESVDFSIRPDTKDDIKSSLQSELPGSWHCLKLKIGKFEMLSVPNIGGIRGANFFWLAHGEGKLWGSITGVPDQEFLLISCSNSTRKRGDGGGSNALSSRLAGSEIIHIWDPKSSHDFTSVTVRCATIIAVGGRLDWLDAISSFFTLPSPEVEKASDGSLAKGDLNAPSETSFILKLVDIGISYEPHLKNSVVGALHSETGSLYSKEETAHDHGGTYSVEYLHKMGYAKVAHEALFEAILRTDCKNGLLWELECSKSHIYLETCHDTTYGLIHLAAQFQQLFAPDLEESVVHLQNRWNSVRQAQERNKLNDEGGISNHDCVPSTSQACQLDSNGSEIHVSLDDSLLGEACSLSVETPDFFSDDLSYDGSVPLAGLEKLSIGRQTPSEKLKCKSKNFDNADHGRGNGGWYGDTPLSIFEKSHFWSKW
ncbi:autophagy-related protein 2-like isoform X2 [Populus alba x Populus x berolinensis]|uniref:Autophagy-related protein 2 n=1 Tax=Populus alba x Populus x berolinensis TaxID=444605 RepID=A0AAD6R2G3_9ROSI|nr:autophagy-related protein 2-like isoform X2 [Populus alba x Populus x berolinensis]